jgi:carbon monoxide dehydrogenase subunit G
MNVSGEYLFDGPRDLVWETLLDPDVLASVLPGCEKLELVGENEYEGALKIKVGPVQGEFVGKVKLEDLQPPESYTMQVDGRGAPGFVKATGNLELAPADDQTRVSYDGDAQVGGRLASVGQRLVESSAKAIIKQSLEGLNAAVRDRVGAGVGGAASAGGEAGAKAPAPATRKTPSQTAFAATVARDVATDLIPRWVRYGAAGVAAIVILYVIYALLT